MLLLVSFVFSKQKAESFLPHVIFFGMQLYTFQHVFYHDVSQHVFYHDVIRSQIELKLKVNFLMYGYNAGPPMAIYIYTVLPCCVKCVYI